MDPQPSRMRGRRPLTAALVLLALLATGPAASAQTAGALDPSLVDPSINGYVTSIAPMADGRIVVLTAASLMPVEVLVPEGPSFEPRGLAVDGTRLLVTTFKEDPRDVNAAEGRLLVFERGAPAP